MKVELWDKDGVPERVIELPHQPLGVSIRVPIMRLDSSGIDNREYRYVETLNGVRIYRETT